MTDAGDDLRSRAGDQDGWEQRQTYAAVIKDFPSDARRHSSDRAAYEMLRDSGFNPAYWDLLAERLVSYGFRVLLGWLTTGKIIQKCLTQGHGSPYVPTWLMSDDLEAREIRQELVWETLANGLVIFRSNLEAGRWDPNAGRSLATYFVAGCVYAFPNVLRQWRNSEVRWEQATKAMLQDGTLPVEPHVYPFDIIDTLATLESLVSDESKRNANVIRLYFHGCKITEIGRILGLSESATRRIIRQWQSRARSILAEGDTNNGSLC